MRPTERSRFQLELGGAWALAVVLAVIAGVAVSRQHIVTADEHHPQAIYSLTAAAQALAAILGLVLATATVVAQLRGLFSRHTLGAGHFREVFGGETVIMVSLYGVVIWVELAVVSSRYVTAGTVKLLLFATAVCISGLAPYLVLLRRRLSPASSLSHARASAQKRLGLAQATRTVAIVQDFALTAVEQHDYGTLRDSLDVLSEALDRGRADDGRAIGSAAASAFGVIARVGVDDPLTVTWVLQRLCAAAGRLHSAQTVALPDPAAEAAQQICTVVSGIADRAVLAAARDDAGLCADILGQLGEELSLSDCRTPLAVAVSGLVMLKIQCVDERMIDVCGKASYLLGRIRPGASASEPWERRMHTEPYSPNLLLNGSFEFGHDFGFGREPGWHLGPFAASMWIGASPYPAMARSGQTFLHVIANSNNESVAQDVPITPGIGESFQVVCRVAAAGGKTVRGRLALWALGSISERGVTAFELVAPRDGGQASLGGVGAGANWQVVRAPLDVSHPGHSALRAEVYIDHCAMERPGEEAEFIPGGEVLIDDVAIVPVNLHNASFEHRDKFPWRQVGAGQWSVESDSPSNPGGECYARLVPLDGSLSIRQEIALVSVAGRRYELSMGMRSVGEEAARIRLDVRIDDAEDLAVARFGAHSEWQVVYLPFTLPRTTQSATGEVSCDVGITVEQGQVDIDSVAVVPTLLQAGDFEPGGVWRASAPAAVSVREGRMPAYGSSYIGHIDGRDGAVALWQDLVASPRVGTSYRFAIRARLISDRREDSTLTLKLLALNKAGEEIGGSATRVDLSKDWLVASVPFDCARGDITRLRALIEIPTGLRVDVGGATFNPLVVA